MNSFIKRLRHWYWLLTAFLKKNGRFIAVSFIIGFFLIIIAVNIFPFINSLFFSKREIVGLVGTYQVEQPPEEIAQLISNPLVTVDQFGDIQPILAESWEVRDNGKTYRFFLKKDLFWTDRKPFKASDIKLKIRNVKLKVIDDHTIDFVLDQQLNIFPTYLNQPIIRNPLKGVVPLYNVQSYKSKKGVLEAVYLSPNKQNTPFRVYKLYKTEDDLIQAYKKGEIFQFTTSNSHVADVFSSWKNTVIERDVDYSQIMTLFINTASGLLQERDVRKAIAYSIPPFTERGVQAQGVIPPTSWAFAKGERVYPQSKDKSEGLIKKYSSSDSAQFNLFTFYEYAETAEAIKKNLNDIGIKVNLKVVSYIPDNFDLLLTVWTPPQDPDQYFFWHSTQATNLTKVKNVKIDKLLEDGRRFMNVKQRANIYSDFQKTIYDEAPALFLYHPFVYTVMRR